MKRWTSDFISQQKSKLIDYNVPAEHYTASLVDRSHFVPIAEALKSLDTAHDVQLHYDFNNGIDDGRELPLSRKPGRDIAEYSRRVAELQEDAKKSIKKAQDFEAAKKAAEARTAELTKSMTGGKTVESTKSS